MGCGCGKKKAAPLARRGFTASADEKPKPKRPATWNGRKPKENE